MWLTVSSGCLDPCTHDNTCCFLGPAWALRTKLRISSPVVSTLISSATTAAGRHEDQRRSELEGTF